MFHYFSAESRVPSDHPLRAIKDLTERALREISSDLDALYPNNGRPSIAPERLLKGQLCMALYSVRSDRQFCEQLDYNILFRWFLDMNLEAPTLDQSNFSRLRTRLSIRTLPAVSLMKSCGWHEPAICSVQIISRSMAP